MPTTAGSDTPRARAARTKRARTRTGLLDAARTKFIDGGWAGTRIEDVASQAGVSVPTAYQHFRSKHTLVAYAYAPLMGAVLDAAQRRSASGLSTAEELEAHLRDLVAMTCENEPLTRVLVEAAQEYTSKVAGPPQPDDHDDPRNIVPLPVLVVELIRAGQEAGEFLRFPPAADLGPQITNLLLLRALTRPGEEPGFRAEIVLTMLFGTLQPQRIIVSGPDSRPFARN